MTLSKPTKEEKFLIANDLGYGWVKAEIKSSIDGEDVQTQVKMPSILAVKKQQNNFDPVSFENKGQEEVYMRDFLSHLDMTVNSPAVNMQGRFLVGQSLPSRTGRAVAIVATTFNCSDKSSLFS